LISAWGAKRKRIKKQALIPFDIGETYYEQVFMVAPNLMAEAIIGANFLSDYGVMTDFKERSFTTRQHGQVSRHSFSFNGMAKEEDRGTLATNPGLTVKDSTNSKAIDQDRSMTYTIVRSAGVSKPELSGLQAGPQDNIKMNELGCGMRIPTVLYDESDEVLSDEDNRALFPDDICLFNDSLGPENGHLVARSSYRTSEEERGHCKILKNK
jgi:hypothetical protein